MSSHHTEQKCKVCSQDFKTTMDLLSHVAQEHHEEEKDKVKERVRVKVSKSVKKIKIQLKRAINVKKNTDVKKMMICDLCDYNCKKSVTLKKHMAIKHQYNKDDGSDEYSSEDEVFSLSEIKHHKDNNAKSHKSFVFSESMLDEFDPMTK